MNRHHPYDEAFLQRQIELHRFVFHKFLTDKNHDVYSIIDTYLQTSELRAKIDIGNLIALNTGGKGPLISIDIFKCEKKTVNYQEPSLEIIHWMADVYCTIQWMYNLPSKEISKILPSKELAGIYDKYYSNSLKSACRDIYEKYLTKITPLDQIKEENHIEKEFEKMKKIDSFRDEYYFLSNFYEAPITYNGITYQNNEAAFQAQKCTKREDQLLFSKLNSSEAKKLGRQVSLRSDWESVKINIMQEVVFAKFSQNPALAEKLINTGIAYLEEGNTWGDRIWGTVNGQGANNLGLILMEVREKIKQKFQEVFQENQYEEKE